MEEYFSQENARHELIPNNGNNIEQMLASPSWDMQNYYSVSETSLLPQIIKMMSMMENITKEISNLSNKLENLENRFININEFEPNKNLSRLYIPQVSYEQWIDSFTVNMEILKKTYKQGILTGFKECIIENIGKYKSDISIDICNNEERKMRLPIVVLMRPKRLQIYCDNEWQTFTEANLEYFIQEIWRKFLMLFLENQESLDFAIDFGVDNNSSQYHKDIFMKNILEMKKKILQNHKKEIIRILFDELKKN